MHNILLILFWGISVLCTAIFANQNQFGISFSLYSLSFIAFYLLWKNRDELQWRTINSSLLIMGSVLFFKTPNLSPDYYRFLWDGQLILDGVNPYAYTPMELINEDWVANSAYYQELYEGITQLSKENYSCYPSINQFYFALSNLLSSSIWVNLLLMRILMMGTLVILYIYSRKILKLLNKEEKSILILVFNPFVFQELLVNLHFEGVMIAFLAVSLYFLLKKKLLLSALFFALAVNVKLTPLLLLPFVFKTLSFGKTSLYYFYTIIISLILSSLLLWPQYYGNFSQSLALYFANFEFNSFIYKAVYELLYPFYTWETVYIVGPILSYLSIACIIILALSRKDKSVQSMLQSMLLAYLIYLLLGSTLHPWYLTTVLFFAVFTKNRFVVFWTYVIALSYAFYDNSFSDYTTFILIFEYSILVLFLLLQGRKEKLLQ